MPGIPGVNHQDAVRALQKAGFRVARQGKHIVMTDGVRIITIPGTTPSTHLRWAGSFAMPGSVKKSFARSCNVWSHNVHIRPSALSAALQSLNRLLRSITEALPGEVEPTRWNGPSG